MHPESEYPIALAIELQSRTHFLPFQVNPVLHTQVPLGVELLGFEFSTKEQFNWHKLVTHLKPYMQVQAEVPLKS